jgi:hypothetical protein
MQLKQALILQSLANTFGGLLRSNAVTTRTKRMLRRVPAFKYCDMGVYPFSQMWFDAESIWLSMPETYPPL